MEPISAPPMGPQIIPLGMVLEDLKGEGPPELGIEEGAIPPGDETLKIELSAEDQVALTRDLFDIRDAFDSAMPERHRVWKSIKDAYNLVPDPLRQGLRPDSSRLVSELIRSQVNTASARLEESLLGVHPFMKFEVWFDDEDDPETAELVAKAKAAEEFFENYSATDLEVTRWLPLAIHRECKLGTAVAYVQWKVEKKRRRFRNTQGEFEDTSDDYGRIDVQLVPNENMIVWPLHETDAKRLTVVGHRTFYTPAEFRAWAPTIKLGAERVVEIIAAAIGDGEGKRPRDEDLEGKDVRTVGRNPFKGQIEITELWCDLPLPGETEIAPFQAFLHEKSGVDKALLYLGKHPYHCGVDPYFEFSYWVEDGSYWASGIGHELRYAQAADSTLMNLLTDNLKIISNYVRLVRAGSTAEALQDQIGPGMNIVTEDPEKDVIFEPMGGDLSHIYQAMDRNDMRATKATGVTAPLQGMGDPVLKSGASPSSLQMLINEAGMKFGKVDKNGRRTLERMYGFFLELIQQYAPDGIFYAKATEQKADLLRRMKYTAPAGDLSRMFRIRVEAPSATSNREVLKQNIMNIYVLAKEHTLLMLKLGQEVLGVQDPAGFDVFKRQILELLGELFKQIVAVHDLPGIGGKLPKIPAPTPEHQLINQLQATVQQLTQQLQQMQQQMAMATQGGMPGGAPGQPMAAAGPQPGLPGPVPAPAG